MAKALDRVRREVVRKRVIGRELAEFPLCAQIRYTTSIFSATVAT